MPFTPEEVREKLEILMIFLSVITQKAQQTFLNIFLKILKEFKKIKFKKKKKKKKDNKKNKNNKNQIQDLKVQEYLN